MNLCFSPDRDFFTKWHSTEGARVRAWVKENGRNKDHLRIDLNCFSIHEKINSKSAVPTG